MTPVGHTLPNSAFLLPSARLARQSLRRRALARAAERRVAAIAARSSSRPVQTKREGDKHVDLRRDDH